MNAFSYDEHGMPRGWRIDPEWEVSPRRARALMDDGAVLLDCRTPAEHATARIVGSLLVPLNELKSRLSELRAHEERTVIVHCHHGQRSLRAAALLRSEGFDRVFSMAGGIELWSLSVDEHTPRY